MNNTVRLTFTCSYGDTSHWIQYFARPTAAIFATRLGAQLFGNCVTHIPFTLYNKPTGFPSSSVLHTCTTGLIATALWGSFAHGFRVLYGGEGARAPSYHVTSSQMSKERK